MDTKGPSPNIHGRDFFTGTDVKNVAVEDEKRGTQFDEADMDRMGKLQQFRRNFKFLSIFSYAVILGATWEFALVVIGVSLSNGGTAGGIWMFLVVCFGMFFVMLSMAEMASMAPTSGGQYHWVSEIAPRKYQKFLSYLVGWMCVIGWQTALAATALATTQQIQGLIALNYPAYDIQGWQSALFCIAVSIVALIWNTVLVRTLPAIEKIGLILHVCGFFAFVAVLWAMAPRTDAKIIWTDFEDNSGWGNTGLSTLIGILGPMITLIGSDSSCHLSEELRDASWVLPRAMFTAAIINYMMGFVMTITIMSALGGDVPTILGTRLGQPWIQILYNATESRVGTSIMTAMVCLLLLFCAISVITTASRQLFAFARDNGLPASNILSYVRPGWDVPLNAIIATLGLTVILSLVVIGSTIAFNVITSLGMLGLLSSYMIAISCILAKRLRGEMMLQTRFSLGKLGMVVNIIALCFLSVAFTFIFFPVTPNPSPESMNWSCLMFGFILTFSMIYYHIWGKHNYVGPVEYVKVQ
ncbi:amino acid transporter [Corynespora cassiicola Philippines]|uniref:Amino acid transporter n=1 Tax=Corynespora cassiicola Philippines TaxID=1448308 RepID=A0A2T2NX80_CORCC|nr:amino acid transporter [Corynespora cassiicola Philippines]